MDDMLHMSWSTSRGRDTYGWNIARLDCASNGKRYRCKGGGYDMVGTVVAQWLQDVHQDRLQGIADRAHRTYDADPDVMVKAPPVDALYGMTRYDPDGTVSVDGACGIESVVRIAAAAGVKLTRTWNRQGNTTGYVVELQPV